MLGKGHVAAVWIGLLTQVQPAFTPAMVSELVSCIESLDVISMSTMTFVGYRRIALTCQNPGSTSTCLRLLSIKTTGFAYSQLKSPSRRVLALVKAQQEFATTQRKRALKKACKTRSGHVVALVKLGLLTDRTEIMLNTY